MDRGQGTSHQTVLRVLSAMGSDARGGDGDGGGGGGGNNRTILRSRTIRGVRRLGVLLLSVELLVSTLATLGPRAPSGKTPPAQSVVLEHVLADLVRPRFCDTCCTGATGAP